MPPGTSEEIADWWGCIKSTEPGAQYDDYFERQDLGQIIYFGIDSMEPADLKKSALSLVPLFRRSHFIHPYKERPGFSQNRQKIPGKKMYTEKL